MSVILDFSFNNPMIRDYFNGSEKYVPTSELLYVHSHPLIQPNFVAQVEYLINETAEKMSTKKGSPVNKFIQLAQSLGKLLPILSDSNAAEALVILREIYQFCNKVIGKV